MRKLCIFLTIFLIYIVSLPCLWAAESEKETNLLEDLLTPPFLSIHEIEKQLEMHIFNLMPVTVTASRIPSALGDVVVTHLPHNITVIGLKELQSNGWTSIPEVLSQKEGVTYSDETGQGLNGRVDLRSFGGEAKQALVLFDNTRIVEPFDNSTVWHLYPVEYVKQIEIQRGGGSMVFGEGAFSGVIRLITKEPTEDFHLETQHAWGGFRTEKHFVEASGTVGDLGLYIGSRYLSTSGYRVNSDHESVSTLIKGELSLSDRVQIKNAWYFADNMTGIPGPLIGQEVIDDRRQQDPDGQAGDQFADKVVQNDLTVNFLLEDWGVELSSAFGFRLRNQDSNQSFGGTFGGESVNDIETESFSNILQGTWKWAWGNLESDVVGGIEWSKDDINNPFTFRSFTFAPFSSERSLDRRMVGAYLQNHFVLSDRIIMDMGIRWDEIHWDIYNQKAPTSQRRKEAEEWSPKLGLEIKLAETIDAYFSFAKSFKAPDANTLIFETPNIFTPNPDIDSQVAKHHEAGLRFAHPIFGSVRISIFYIETKKEILFNDITNINENFDTKRQGVELAFEIGLGPNFDVYANYTYADAEFDNGVFDSKSIPLVPESKWSAGFVYTVWENWVVSLGATGTYNQFVLNDFNNIFPADDYWTLGAKIAYQKDNVEVYMRAQNVTDNEFTTFTTSNGVDTVNFNPSPSSYIEGGVTISL